MANKLDQEQAELYTKAGYVNDYEFVSGVFILPVAENAPEDPEELAEWSPTVAVQGHAPYRYRKITYSAKKSNSPPFIPLPADTDAHKFVSGRVMVPYPTLQINGFYEWDATCEYEYVSRFSNEPGDGLVLGQPPFATTIQAQNVLRAVGTLDDAPQDVVQSGIGPQTGYKLGLNVDTSNANYAYSEPTLFPAVFFSADMVDGPASYPTGL